MINRKPEKPTPEPGQSWGLFGGAFDPIHYGHLALAQDIQSALKLAGVLFVPSARPPHRNNVCQASFENRCAMTELAVEHLPTFSCCAIERDENLSGYTIHTIQALKRRHPEVSWYLMVGADNAGTFDAWYHPDEILAESILVIGKRPGFAGKSPTSISAGERIIWVESRLVDISATNVRQLAAAQIPTDRFYELVPPAVARYIVEHRLYRQ
ncbi:MAG: nicotinate (nicotinamide) nucleotide adenylyltransferase [candidate division Zixibacteria bacterium]|nr:nicotinate (nicotinamide) nucleotide adenylyltransferase [candidate division Zixibacteria bacterium]